jgi:hypothetical protein
MRTLTLSALSLALFTTVACGEDTSMMMQMEPPLNEKLVGTWQSMSCESAGSFMSFTLYVKRTYKFTTSTQFQLNADLFFDQSCAFKLFTVDSKGTFAIGNDVTAVQGAKEADFTASERGATAYLQMAVDVLKMVNCGGTMNWSPGVRQDVSAAGCEPLIPSLTKCPKEFDVALLSDSMTLKLGARPTTPEGLCSGRPTTTGLPLLKQ